MGAAGTTADAVVLALAAQPTPAYLGESDAWRNVLTVNTMALAPGEGALLGEAIVRAVEGTR